MQYPVLNWGWWVLLAASLVAAPAQAQKLQVIVANQPEAKEGNGVALSADGAANALPVYIRPNKPHTVYVFIKNDTDTDETVKLEIVNKDGTKLASGEGMVKANAITRITNLKSEAAAPAPPPPAPPGTPAPPPARAGSSFTGDLKVIVSTNGDEVKKETYRLPVRVAEPASYLSVESSFATGVLAVAIKRSGKFAEFVTEKEPCDVTVLITEERVEGLENAGDKDTTRRLTYKDTSAELKIKNIKVKDLSRQQRSQLLVSVDNVPQAFIINQPMQSSNDSLVPGELENNPQITVSSPRYQDPNKPFTLRLDLYKLPETIKAKLATAEIHRGRYLDAGKTASDFELVKGFDVTDNKLTLGAIEGGLQFNNQTGTLEYQVTDAKNLAGKYQFKPLLSSVDSQPVDLRELNARPSDTIFDSSPPDGVKFIDSPKEAKRGDKLKLRAKVNERESGIKACNFYVLLDEGQENVNIPPKPGTLVAGTDDTYELQIEIEPASKANVWYGVKFVNNVDMTSKLESHGIRIVEPMPIAKDGEAGTIALKGKVVDGAGRAQPKLSVALFDLSAKDAKEPIATTKTGTKPAGLFSFDEVKPGKYKLYVEFNDAVGNKQTGEQLVEIKGKEIKVGGKPLKEKDLIVIKVS